MSPDRLILKIQAGITTKGFGPEQVPAQGHQVRYRERVPSLGWLTCIAIASKAEKDLGS